MNKYALIGKLRVKEGSLEELTQLLMEASVLVSKAKGCHLHLIGHTESTLIINKLWNSKQDQDNYLNLEGVRELIGKAMPLLNGMPEKGLEYTSVGGHGI